MKVSKLINELKKVDLNCNVFDVYSYDGVSMQDLLCMFFTKINECIDVSNNTIDLTNYLVNEGLNKEVINQLDNWCKDGTIEKIINLDIIKDLEKIIEVVKEELIKKPNTVDVFLKQDGININDFDEATRNTFLQAQGIDVNYTLGVDNVKNIHILNNSIDYEKTNFFNIEKSINVFDYKKSIDGYIVNTVNGSLKQHETGCVSDFIRVNPGDIIRFDNNWDGCFFDLDKQYLSEKPFGETVFTVPMNAYYYRHNINSNIKQNFMITINNSIPSEYVPYFVEISLNEKSKEIIKNFIEDEKIKADDTDFATRKPTINIFNKDKITTNYIVSTKGELIQQDGGCASDFIEVESDTTYYINSNWNGCFYDKYKRFISQKDFGLEEFKTPVNCKYIRLSIPTDLVNTYMLSKSKITSYVPYDGYFKFKDTNDLIYLSEQLKSIINNEELVNKNWVVLGDSLTEKNIRATKNYHDYISEETGINVINFGVSGTGYKKREGKEDGYQAFYQRVVDVPLNTDIITIFGSGNDLSLIDKLGTPTDTTTETICGCMNETIKRIYNKLPGVKVGIILPCPWGAYPPYVSNNPMERYSNALKEVAKRHSIPVLDLYYGSNLRPWDETFKNLYYKHDDGNSVHPDEDGQKLLANKIKMFIKSL